MRDVAGLEAQLEREISERESLQIELEVEKLRFTTAQKEWLTKKEDIIVEKKQEESNLKQQLDDFRETHKDAQLKVNMLFIIRDDFYMSQINLITRVFFSSSWKKQVCLTLQKKTKNSRILLIHIFFFDS